MKRGNTAWIVAGALLLASLPAHAGIVTGLYEARVPVADQSPVTRRAALQQAFSMVLVRVTGARSADGPLAALAAKVGYNDYVTQSRYEQAAPADIPAPASPPASVPTPTLVLWVKFDREKVDAAIADAHIAVWGAERPVTLVWLVIQDSPSGHVLAANDESPVMQSLTRTATERGINLVFPQMDGPDRNAIGVADITGVVQDRIRQASARYPSDSILVGTLSPFGTGQFAASWQLLFGNQQENWNTQPADQASAAADGVESAVDRYVTRLAIASDASSMSGVPLVVEGVNSLDAYAKVLAYLGTLTPVKSVHVQRVEQGVVYFDVDIHGSLDNLRDAVVLGGLLTSMADPIAAAAATAAQPTAAVPVAPLRYRYGH